MDTSHTIMSWSGCQQVHTVTQRSKHSNIHISRDRALGQIRISQELYVEALLDRFGMADCSPCKTPFPSGSKPVPATDAEVAAARHHPYAAIVGCLLYPSTISQADLAQATSVLSRFISRGSEAHYLAAKHLLRYLRGTSAHALVYNASKDTPIVQGYADMDWAGDLDTCRSTTGYIFQVYGGLVAWRSQRQPTVALSTTEAEYC
jgi:hypothetical protein